jgi:FtsZ-binding cell division protein ZapB
VPGLVFQNTDTGTSSINSIAFSNAATAFSGGYYGALLSYIPTGGSTANVGGALTFATKSTTTSAWYEAMRLIDGNVGIGTTSPGATLQVAGGNILLDNQTNILFKNTTGATGAVLRADSGDNVYVGDIFNGFGGGLGLRTGGSNRVWIKADGNVGIGTTAPGYTLHVVGTAGLSTGTAWTNASDLRLKDIAGDYDLGLNEVMQLHTVRFTYKQDNPLGIPAGKLRTGFIAQEVREVIPEAVTQRSDGYLELNVDPIHWAVVNAVKELGGDNLQQAADITLLKVENKQLKAESEQLKAESEQLKAESEQLKAESEQLKAAFCSKFPEMPFCSS